MFQLENEVKFEVSLADIGGKSILLAPGNIRSLSIIENKGSLLPECVLVFEDMQDYVAKALLGDGAKIKVLIAPDSNRGQQVSDFTFRVFSTPGIGNTILGKSLTVNGIADAPSYFRNVANKAYKGNSSDVIEKVAKEHGFKADVDSTSDEMTWLPRNVPISQWLRQLSEHGYRGAESFMKMVITDKEGQWTLRYKDVTKQMQENPTVTLASLGIDNNAISILHYMITNQSGFMNNVFGYNSQTGQQKLSGDHEAQKDVSIRKSTKSLEMNSEVKGKVNLGFRDWLPPETGNTHTKYAEAHNQNRRISSTYSIKMSVLVNDYTRASLLDPIQVRVANNMGNEVDEVYSGKYLLVARTRHVQGKFYRERLSLESQGVNKDGGGRVS